MRRVKLEYSVATAVEPSARVMETAANVHSATMQAVFRTFRAALAKGLPKVPFYGVRKPPGQRHLNSTFAATLRHAATGRHHRRCLARVHLSKLSKRPDGIVNAVSWPLLWHRETPGTDAL